MREKQERSEFGERNNGGYVDLSLLMASIPAISSSGLAIVNCLAYFEGGGGDEGGEALGTDGGVFQEAR